MRRISSYLGVALAVLLMTVNVLPVSAAVPGGSAGLSIPPRKNYIIEPGHSITDKLTIGNLDPEHSLNLSLRMIDFTFTGQTGTPKLDLAQNAPLRPWSIRPYTTLPSSVTIQPGGTTTIKYSIRMPKNIGAGSYYSAILYDAAGGNGGNVALTASGVTLVFVSVPGIVNENLQLQKFGAYESNNNGATGGFVFIATNGAPKMIGYVLKNKGNVFESPAGSIIIKDMFGHQVANIDTNTTQELALLGQSRLFTSCIKTKAQEIRLEGGTSTDTSCVDPGLAPGEYTAHLELYYGQNGNQTHEITNTVSFWYLPWWFLALIAVGIGILIWAFFWTKRKLQAAVKGTTYHEGRGIRRLWRR